MEWERILERSRRAGKRVKLALFAGALIVLVYGVIKVWLGFYDFCFLWDCRVGDTYLLFLYLLIPYIFSALALVVAGLIAEKWLNLERTREYVVFLLLIPFLCVAVSLPLGLSLGFYSAPRFIYCSAVSLLLLLCYAVFLWLRRRLEA